MSSQIYKKICFCWPLLLFLLFTGCTTPRYNSQPSFNRYPSRPIQQRPEIYYEVPPAPVKAAAPKKKKSNTLVIIDPGHGGKDLGTHSLTAPKYQEKVLTLSTSRLLKTYLEQLGYEAILTRNDDTFIALDKRAEFANKYDPSIFISVHFNSAPNKDAHGIEVFYYRSDKDKARSNSSKALAKSILNRMLSETEAKSRGVKHGDLSVIRQTNMPAVLIEGGFLSNSDERVQIKDSAYLKKIAWGIAQGIDNYLSD